MDIDQLFGRLFPDGCTIAAAGELLRGVGTVGGRTVAIVGTTDDAAIGVELALAMAREVLHTVAHHPERPIVFLVDTQGQRLRHRDELLGIHAYMTHLAQSLEVARRAGHRIVSLVYGRAVSGGYITGGMMADTCHALVSAEISVMNLPAMARVTKIPQARLEALAETSPVFAPGADNYLRMGALDSVWTDDLAGALCDALAAITPASGGRTDHRRDRGDERGGRTMACAIAHRVRTDGVD